jgi:hypothetical protein
MRILPLPAQVATSRRAKQHAPEPLQSRPLHLAGAKATQVMPPANPAAATPGP